MHVQCSGVQTDVTAVLCWFSLGLKLCLVATHAGGLGGSEGFRLPSCCLAEAFCDKRGENVLYRSQVDSFSLNLEDSFKSGDH